MNEPTNDIDHAAIERHYAHAVAKHPHFCDMLFDDTHIKCADVALRFERGKLAWEQDNDREEAVQILATEIIEIIDAYARRDYAAAVEECHDSIAVLLRMAKMIADEGAKAGAIDAKEGEVAK